MCRSVSIAIELNREYPVWIHGRCDANDDGYNDDVHDMMTKT